MTCSHTSDCPLFAQFAMEPALELWKKHYCDGEYTKCARYGLSLKGSAVPIALMPNGKMIEAKVKSKEELGGTALFNAILKQRVPMVKSMLASKMATIDVTSNDGSTPLMIAASIGNIEILEFLLSVGCNPFIENKNGITALAVAEHKKFPGCAKLIKNHMDAHPDLKNKTSNVSNIIAATEDEEAAEMKGVVSLLKKINPFSR